MLLLSNILFFSSLVRVQLPKVSNVFCCNSTTISKYSLFSVINELGTPFGIIQNFLLLLNLELSAVIFLLVY